MCTVIESLKNKRENVMVLNKKDGELYYSLRDDLYLFAANAYFAKKVSKLVEKNKPQSEVIHYVGTKIYESPNVIIDHFVRMNPNNLSQENLNIISQWKKCISGIFQLIEHDKDCSIFMSLSGPIAIYGVKGIHEPIKQIYKKELPVTLKTILLPFKDCIIYEGVMEIYPKEHTVDFTKTFNDEYKRLRDTLGIISKIK